MEKKQHQATIFLMTSKNSYFAIQFTDAAFYGQFLAGNNFPQAGKVCLFVYLFIFTSISVPAFLFLFMYFDVAVAFVLFLFLFFVFAFFICCFFLLVLCFSEGFFFCLFVYLFFRFSICLGFFLSLLYNFIFHVFLVLNQVIKLTDVTRENVRAHTYIQVAGVKRQKKCGQNAGLTT